MTFPANDVFFHFYIFNRNIIYRILITLNILTRFVFQIKLLIIQHNITIKIVLMDLTQLLIID